MAQGFRRIAVIVSVACDAVHLAYESVGGFDCLCYLSPWTGSTRYGPLQVHATERICCVPFQKRLPAFYNNNYRGVGDQMTLSNRPKRCRLVF